MFCCSWNKNVTVSAKKSQRRKNYDLLKNLEWNFTTSETVQYFVASQMHCEAKWFSADLMFGFPMILLIHAFNYSIDQEQLQRYDMQRLSWYPKPI